MKAFKMFFLGRDGKMRHQEKTLQNQNGWILIESLIAMTVLVTGVLAIMASHTQSTKTVVYSDNMTQATYLAQQQLEMLKKKYDITSSKPDLTQCATASGIYTISCTEETATEAISPVSGLSIFPVTVKVSWTDAANQNSVSVSTYYFYGK